MIPARGTLLNTAAVIAGSSLGLVLGHVIPPSLVTALLPVLGLFVTLLGIKMFLEVRNLAVVMASITAGALAGTGLNIRGLVTLLSGSYGTKSHFVEAFLAASVLFCVGPMTILGCLEDGLEGKITILGLKSLLDTVSSFLLAVSLGIGVLASAISVFLIQGGLTLSAGLLKRVAVQDDVLKDLSAVGGVIMFAIGMRLAGFNVPPPENLIPALLFAPALSMASRHFMSINAAGDKLDA